MKITVSTQETCRGKVLSKHICILVIRIGDVRYNIDVSKIPYLSSFVNFRVNVQLQSTEFVYSSIPLFDVALKEIESGYRQCFRSLPVDLSQHHTLYNTYELLCVNILDGQSINEIINDLKIGKDDYEREYKRYRKIKDNKSNVRDTAFKLLYLILLGEFQDEMKDNVKIFNAVLFVRTVIRVVYEKRFVFSTNQRARLN